MAAKNFRFQKRQMRAYQNWLMIGLLCVATWQGAWAQGKFGQLNAQALLAELPEIQEADRQLEDYYNQLVAEGRQRAEAFEKAYLAFARQVEAGELAPAQAEKKQAELLQMQQELQGLEAEIARKVEARRQQLYEPVLKKVQAAIEEVGKAQGFTFIFDTSTYLAVLFADEALDVSAAVKAKLGL